MNRRSMCALSWLTGRSYMQVWLYVVGWGWVEAGEVRL